MGKWRYSFITIDLGTWWGCVVSLTPQLLYPQGKSAWYHWIGGWWAPSWSRCCGEDKTSCPCQESNPGHPACHCTDWAVPDIINNIKLTDSDFQQGGNMNTNYCFAHYHMKSRYILWNIKFSFTKWRLFRKSKFSEYKKIIDCLYWALAGTRNNIH
jgi:hypothetical protein